jgi:hypothetical protein
VPQLDINTDAVVELTSKLERIRKRSLPKVVGQTLNNLAFNTKRDLPQNYVKKGFEQRDKNFFKVATRFEKVKSFNVNSMQSVAGVHTGRIKSEAAENLEQQEKGGMIDRDYIPQENARISKSSKKKVQAKNRVSNVLKIPSQNRIRFGQKRKVLRRGIELSKNGGGLLVYGKFVYRVGKSTRKNRFNAKVIHVINPKKKVKVKGRHTVQEAGIKQAKRVNDIYINNIKKEIAKLR